MDKNPCLRCFKRESRWCEKPFNQRPHVVHAYGIDSEGGANAELADSPRTLQCSLPPLQGVKRLLSDPKTFETWGFSLFWDVLPAPDSAFASLPVGEPLPSKPQLVRADDQKPHVWLIDGVYRRHVASMKILLKTLPTQERPVARLCRAVDVELLRLPPFLLVCFGSLCLF